MIIDTNQEDPFQLSRFIHAQNSVFDHVLAELKAGLKTTHWMWFIFPQLRILGKSEIAKFYGIADLNEAHAYLAHPVLKKRLLQCIKPLLTMQNRTALQIFGSTDAKKLQSCMTLFAMADNKPDSVFVQMLKKYFDGVSDINTLTIK